MATSKKKSETESKEKKSKESTKKVSYIHVNDFLRKRKEGVDPNIVESFKLFLSGRTYQHSMEDFEKELEKFYNRFK